MGGIVREVERGGEGEVLCSTGELDCSAPYIPAQGHAELKKRLRADAVAVFQRYDGLVLSVVDLHGGGIERGQRRV